MHTGDLVLRGVGESGDDVESRQSQSTADSFGEEGISPLKAQSIQRRSEEKDNAEALRTQRFAEKSGFLLSDRWYLLS